jgi:carbon starvation protein CstA
MSGILSNGATIILAVLLVLAIAYRYYSAFIAAKLLALDPARPTPAYTLRDGHNYHPTNKWVLFGHHFAAISGAGPLIGPVLAAQFGYLPGLLWILIGVCLAGAVQDFVVLGLSIRRNGRSLAQIAFSEIGSASGTAATIGILFVLVIALAGLGKVVTKALGGETVPYAAGTEFIATEDNPITKDGPAGTVYHYTIPAGTHVRYPPPAKGERVQRDATSQILLKAEAPSGSAVDIEDRTLPPGRLLHVPFGAAVSRANPATVYGSGTEFRAPEDGTITMRTEQNVYYYTLPAGTKVTLPDHVDMPTVTKEAFEITVRAKGLGTRPTGQLQQIRVPLNGAIVTREAPTKQVFESGTEFVAVNTPITALGMTDNVYRYLIPARTTINDPHGIQYTADAAFEITVRPADITVTQADGYRLVVPAAPAGMSVTEEIPGSSWGTFTIFLTIPIAFMTGIYLYRIRKGRVLEASILGGSLTLLAVYWGGRMNADDSFLTPYRQWFNLTEQHVGGAMAVYGFVASILPVWMLLCPRDYLSSFLKIGTISLLVLGVVVAHPHLRAPAINGVFLGGGPVVPGAVFPFVFITIMCGAVSGFHALVASGTTPKMINNESDARLIGYGAMLIEGLVGIVALIAASALPVAQYYDINTPPESIPQYQADIQRVHDQDKAANTLDEQLPDVGEHVQGRTGGAVTLAMGMAHVLNTAVNNVIGNPAKPPPWLTDLFRYWYHFAIMFEALFILTTIDTGTRVGRFLLQETMGKWITPKLGQTDWWPSAILSTAVITGTWWYFLDSNAFPAIWAMFGVANQMLAVMALAIASATLVRIGKRRYVAVTLVPMCFVTVTTCSAAVLKLMDYGKPVIGYVRAIRTASPPAFPTNPLISGVCVLAILACSAVVVGGALWIVYGKPAVTIEIAAAKT